MSDLDPEPAFDLQPTLRGRLLEIGWTFLAKAFWGGSYNRELKSLMIGHAFRFVDRVVFVAGEGNLRSQRALEKIGASRLRSEERHARDGSMERVVVFCITHQPAIAGP